MRNAALLCVLLTIMNLPPDIAARLIQEISAHIKKGEFPGVCYECLPSA